MLGHLCLQSTNDQALNSPADKPLGVVSMCSGVCRTDIALHPIGLLTKRRWCSIALEAFKTGKRLILLAENQSVGAV